MITLKPKAEADTCREYVVPKLQAAGWENQLQTLLYAA
jgi:type I site-specific restriction endonuclease